MTQTTEFDGVLFLPGQEPEDIKRRIETLFAKLDGAYPDKIIIGLHKEHKKWGETVTKLYRLLGYPNGNAFLEAYGYTVKQGASGRPAGKHMDIINELKRRNSDGPVCKTILELKKANPDLAPKFKNLTNQADKLFGMTFAKYLVQEGILVGETDNSEQAFSDLKACCLKPFKGTIKELQEAYPEIDWKAVKRYCERSEPSMTFQVFLINHGVLSSDEESIEDKIAKVTDELKGRYPEPKKFKGTLDQLKSENPDIPISSLNIWTNKAYQKSAIEYLIQQGIVEEINETIADDSCYIIENNKLTKFRFKGKGTIVIIPDEVKCILDGAFESRKKITSVIIPKGVTKIGRNTFKNCESLTKVIIPDTVTSIEEGAFKYCKSLTEIEIPESVTRIGFGAFSGCSALERITIPDGVKEICCYAFSDCLNIKAISIPASVTRIDSYSFSGCRSLSKLSVNKDNEVYDSRNDCNAIIETATDSLIAACKDTRIPDDTVHIKEGAFQDCISLTSISIPDNVVSIGRSAFWGCTNMKRVILPDSIVDIGWNAFWKCDSLDDITIPKDYLSADHKEDAEIVINLFQMEAWKNAATGEDYAILLLNQKSYEILDFIDEVASEKADEITQGLISLLKETKKAAYFNKAAEFCVKHHMKITNDTIFELYELVSSSNNKKAGIAKSILEPLITVNESGANDSEEDIELFCKRNFPETVITKLTKKSGLSDEKFEGIFYSNQNTAAPSYVVKCAILPYFEQLKEKPKYIENYKKDYVKFSFNHLSDKVAETLDKSSFQNLLDDLMGKRLPEALELIIPYCRFASGKQILDLMKKMKKWENWNAFHASGRKAIIIANGALALNDSREAMLALDGIGLLSLYSELRKTDEDDLRDTVLSNFGFDSIGRKKYHLGKTSVEISLDQHLTLHISDVDTGREIDKLPQAGNDPLEIDLAERDIVDIKANLVNVIENYTNHLKRCFLHYSEKKPFKKWKKVFIDNPVLKQLGETLVWISKDKSTSNRVSFMVRNEVFINSNNEIISIPDTAFIELAHPMVVDAIEVHRWREFLISNEIKQPFIQMFETVYDVDFESLSNRYMDAEIPFGEIRKLYKEGFVADGDKENGFEISYESVSIRISFWMTDNYVYSVKQLGNDSVIVLGTFRVLFKRMDKMLNHTIYLFDHITIQTQIKKDNAEVIDDGHLIEYSISQIDELIRVATDNKAANCIARLLDYKNRRFSTHNSLDEFVL